MCHEHSGLVTALITCMTVMILAWFLLFSFRPPIVMSREHPGAVDPMRLLLSSLFVALGVGAVVWGVVTCL